MTKPHMLRSQNSSHRTTMWGMTLLKGQAAGVRPLIKWIRGGSSAANEYGTYRFVFGQLDVQHLLCQGRQAPFLIPGHMYSSISESCRASIACFVLRCNRVH